MDFMILKKLSTTLGWLGIGRLRQTTRNEEAENSALSSTHPYTFTQAGTASHTGTAQSSQRNGNHISISDVNLGFFVQKGYLYLFQRQIYRKAFPKQLQRNRGNLNQGRKGWRKAGRQAGRQEALA